MEMKFLANGVGFSANIPLLDTKVGFTVFSQCYIGFRHTQKSNPILYNLHLHKAVGEEAETKIYSFIKSNWFSLLSDKTHILPDVTKLNGIRAEF